MLDEKNKVFLELSLENLSSESNYFKNNMIKFGINIDSINIDNMQEKNEDFRHILNYSKQNNNNKPIINIQKHFYNIPGVTQETQWTIYDVYGNIYYILNIIYILLNIYRGLHPSPHHQTHRRHLPALLRLLLQKRLQYSPTR